MYVGKLRKDDKLSDDSIKEFFANYGAIAAVEQPFDKVRTGSAMAYNIRLLLY